MNQLGLFDAEARGRVGMERAAEHADQVHASWSDRAYEAFLVAARARLGSFTAEEVRLQVRGLPEPPDQRAWGAVVQRAIRAGAIRKTGVYAPRASGNGTPTMTYVARGAG